MKVQIEFDCDNAAFADNFTGEVCWILERVRERIQALGYLEPPEQFSAYVIRDGNGNQVGQLSFDEGD